MISKTAEHAVRACVWLAEHPGHAWTVQRIASATNVPAKYLGKVLQLLGRAQLVRAQPGPGGGFALNKEASQICVLEIIEAVDPPPRGRTDSHPDADGLRPLHARLRQARARVEASLRRCTLADLLREATFPIPKEGSDL
ncbi:MAG: Rrf2 family transcriptional regulator [Phycisphaerae bacterium]